MGESEAVEEATTITYDIVAVSIFAVMAFVFLFPLNAAIPLDRRTIAVLGSVVCYTTRAFCFPHKSNLSIIDAVDWDVLLLLASIMVSGVALHSNCTMVYPNALSYTFCLRYCIL